MVGEVYVDWVVLEGFPEVVTLQLKQLIPH